MAAKKKTKKTAKKTTAKKAATKKTTAKKAATKKSTAKKTEVKRSAASKAAADEVAVTPEPVAFEATAVAQPTVTTVTREERQRMIAEAAYYRSLERGDQAEPGRDWAEAEAAIDAMHAEHGVEMAE